MKTIRTSTPPLLAVLSLSLLGVSCAPGPSTSTPPPRTTPAARARATPRATPRTTPTAPTPLVAKWTLKTKGELARIAGRRGSTVYLSVGDYLSHGLPTRWIYAVDGAAGTARWVYSLVQPKQPYTVKVGPKALELDAGGNDTFWITWAGKKQTRPPKPSLDDKAPNITVGCNLTGKTISCRDMDDMKELWTRTYAHKLAQEKVLDNRWACFAEHKTLRLRCLDARTGKPRAVIDVPRVPKVKSPERASFTYIIVPGWIVVANYNNVVTGYALPKK